MIISSQMYPGHSIYWGKRGREGGGSYPGIYSISGSRFVSLYDTCYVFLIVCLFISCCSYTASIRVQFVYGCFWFAAVLATLAFIFKTGRNFVNQPRLRAKDKDV